jgi:hypothetical protein
MKDDHDPLEELARLIGGPDYRPKAKDPDDYVMGVYDNHTGRLVTIRHTTPDEKEKLREILRIAVHARIFNRY